MNQNEKQKIKKTGKYAEKPANLPDMKWYNDDYFTVMVPFITPKCPGNVQMKG
jgi:hypothetical protein